MSVQKKRVTVKPKKPNPLFEQWLQEWRAEAASKGSDMQYCFGKALASLRKYPLQLSSGKECAILQNFGTRLCIMLDRKLAQHKKDHPDVLDFPVSIPEVPLMPQPSKPAKSKTQITHVKEGRKTSDNTLKATQKKQLCNKDSLRPSASHSPAKKKRNTGSYVPALRSGPYALLLTLLSLGKEEDYPGCIAKADLQKAAQPLCDASFTRPDPGSHYTAWSSMSTLIKKGLVSSAGRGKYSLTSEGEILAQKLKDADNYESQVPNLHSDLQKSPLYNNGESLTCSTASPVKRFTPEGMTLDAAPTVQKGPSTIATASGVPMKKPVQKGPSTIATTSGVPKKKPNKKQIDLSSESVILTPASFDVILLIDTQEASGVGGRKGSDDSALNDLQKQNVMSEIRHLKVGDFAWICRERISGIEVILPYIVERKRVDDFAQSIMDGRFREQKFRLKQSGISNLIYLVEKHGRETHTALPLATLNQAAVNTQIIDNFTVKYTANHKDSVAYLAMFTRTLRNLFQMKTLVMCSKKDLPEFCVEEDIVSLMSFEEFNKSSMKTRRWTVRDMFIKHLVQLNGVSVEKALAIIERYPTPYALISAFNESGDEKLLANIPYGALGRRIGPVVSQALYRLYTYSVLS